MMSLEAFKSLFKFDPALSGHIGIERECFIASKSEPNNVIVPRAPAVLKLLERFGVPLDRGFEPPREGEFGYELSACQIESRVGPCEMANLRCKLAHTEDRLNRLLGHYDMRPLHAEVGPEDMPLDVYPDPTGRYQKITRCMPRAVLEAACRAIGTHVHIGMPDHETALRVYNHVILYGAELCRVGDSSNGARLAMYRTVAPKADPPAYPSWHEYYNTALAEGFAEDPRRCWTLVRISTHGTIEFRMFGATPVLERVVMWATRCRELCLEVFART